MYLNVEFKILQFNTPQNATSTLRRCGRPRKLKRFELTNMVISEKVQVGIVSTIDDDALQTWNTSKEVDISSKRNLEVASVF